GLALSPHRVSHAAHCGLPHDARLVGTAPIDLTCKVGRIAGSPVFGIAGAAGLDPRGADTRLCLAIAAIAAQVVVAAFAHRAPGMKAIVGSAIEIQLAAAEVRKTGIARLQSLCGRPFRAARAAVAEQALLAVTHEDGPQVGVCL